MSPIRLSRDLRPILGWERRAYPPDVILRRKLVDPRILRAYDALVQHPRVVSDYYGPIDYWRKHRLAKALLRRPLLLHLLDPDPVRFCLALAQEFGYLRFAGPYKATLCCACAWPIKSALHQKHCPAETKARRRYTRLKALSGLDSFPHPNMPHVHRATLVAPRVADWRPGKALRANIVDYTFARQGLSEYYTLLYIKVGPYQVNHFWTALHLKRRLLPHLPGPQTQKDRLALLRTLAPEAFRRLPSVPIRAR